MAARQDHADRKHGGSLIDAVTCDHAMPAPVLAAIAKKAEQAVIATAKADPRFAGALEDAYGAYLGATSPKDRRPDAMAELRRLPARRAKREAARAEAAVLLATVLAARKRVVDAEIAWRAAYEADPGVRAKRTADAEHWRVFGWWKHEHPDWRGGSQDALAEIAETGWQVPAGTPPSADAYAWVDTVFHRTPAATGRPALDDGSTLRRAEIERDAARDDLSSLLRAAKGYGSAIPDDAYLADLAERAMFDVDAWHADETVRLEAIIEAPRPEATIAMPQDATGW